MNLAQLEKWCHIRRLDGGTALVLRTEDLCTRVVTSLEMVEVDDLGPCLLLSYKEDKML